MNIFEFTAPYFVGIKGVAMTSLAQCLVDGGIKVRGSDVAEEFVTQELLTQLGITIDIGFDTPLPPEINLVVYTSAHQAQDNPQVRAAQQRGIPTLSQAEALGLLFNQKVGVAVAGVGGKSTVSAMITWILEKMGKQPSFSVGVGNIPGLNRTGRWVSGSELFIAEADEYVIDPKAAQKGQEITPRFSFLEPTHVVCTNLKFDHPDVYRDFAHTQHVFSGFFHQIRAGGSIVCHHTDAQLISSLVSDRPDLTIVTFGDEDEAGFHLAEYQVEAGFTRSTIKHKGHEATLTLPIPGHYNVRNALAALAITSLLGVPLSDGVVALGDFPSTKRRFEFIGEKKGVKYYDDYAHHPHEIAAVISAFKEWYPDQRRIIAFQPHTYSRTQQLFTELVQSFAEADELILLDIFASAREALDPTVSTDQLATAVSQAFPQMKLHPYRTIEALAQFCQNLSPNTVVLTIGAGDIYQVHSQLT